MKTYKIVLILFLLTFLQNHSVWSQQIIFRKDNQIQRISRTGVGLKTLGTGVRYAEEGLAKTDIRVYRNTEISTQLHISDDRQFYQGIQSPFDPALWIFMEREWMGSGFWVWQYRTDTQEKRLLLDGKSVNDTCLQLAPISWAQDKNNILVEAINSCNAAFRHEGIYVFTIHTKGLQKLNIPAYYRSTPVLSPDRKMLIYTTGLEKDDTRDVVHGISERIASYNLSTQTEETIVQEKGHSFTIEGWAVQSASKRFLMDSDDYMEKQIESQRKLEANAPQSSYKFPWPSGIRYCTTRDGNRESPGGPGSSSKCADLGPHDYLGFDFDTPNNADDMVFSVAEGEVIKVVLNRPDVGYGNYLRVRHLDNTVSLYGHLKSIKVSVGQCVGQGAFLGIEGTTGRSSGDHIHFEREVGGSNTFPRFAECNDCVPHSGYAYTSRNKRNDKCGPGCESNLNLTGTISAGTYTSSSTITVSGKVKSGTVVLDTKDEIYLNPGFDTAGSTEFTAIIGKGCDGGQNSIANRSASPSVTEDNALWVYPNPARTMIRVESTQELGALKLYDLNGRLLLSKPTSGTLIPLDISALPKGIYIIELQNGMSTRIVKQ